MTRIRNLVYVLLAAALLTACNGANVDSSSNAMSDTDLLNANGIVHISNSQLQTLLDNNVTLIDIRRPEEWAHTGVVPGSKKLTFFSKSGAVNPQLVTEIQRIATPGKPVVLICRTGNRTRVAAQMINAQLGYTTVYNVRDGITRWISEGRAVTR